MKKLQNKPYVLDLNVINNIKVVLALLCVVFICDLIYHYVRPFAASQRIAYPWLSFQP